MVTFIITYRCRPTLSVSFHQTCDKFAMTTRHISVPFVIAVVWYSQKNGFEKPIALLHLKAATASINLRSRPTTDHTYSQHEFPTTRKTCRKAMATMPTVYSTQHSTPLLSAAPKIEPTKPDHLQETP
mmetsp:Transcript_8528/g.13203  ORF Transcript_8528/g.13203 Transcript_8528/m.13203 type:complete len:128 (+) Transcript_8528:192-575(+)